jgi:hypothetical protein
VIHVELKRFPSVGCRAGLISSSRFRFIESQIGDLDKDVAPLEDESTSDPSTAKP